MTEKEKMQRQMLYDANYDKELIAERIAHMEEMLNRARRAARQLSAALDEYEAARSAVKQLNSYYGSEEWRRDRADDEAGRLPVELKRGVLSEDAVWNLLEEWRELNGRMKEMGTV